MTASRTSARDRRVTLALKWKYLDNCDVTEIRERFVEHGYGEYARSTIRDYLNEAPKEEVLEQIEAEQANVRSRIIDRHERLYNRAREAELSATEREKVLAVKPAATTHRKDDPIEVTDWEVLDEDELPPGATPFDKRIRFTDETRRVTKGENYYVQDPDGDPIYKPTVVAVEEHPDMKQRSFLRREQSHHLEQQGEAAGVYEENVNLNMDGQVSVEINETRVTEENIDEFEGDE